MATEPLRVHLKLPELCQFLEAMEDLGAEVCSGLP